MRNIIENHYLELLGLVPAVVWLALLAVIVQLDRYIRPELKRILRVIIVMVFTLVVQNDVDYRVAAGEPHWLLRTLATSYGYAVRPVILLLFLRLIAPRHRLWWGWALAGVNAAVSATALFSPICFKIDDRNAYQGGPLSNFCLYVSLILLGCLFVMTFRVFAPKKRRETWVPVIALIIILGSLVLDDNVGSTAQPISFLTIAVITGTIAYYVWLHLQFVREHEEALVAGQRVQLMLSQIKPHFLYNSLNAMMDLCDDDPLLARDAIGRFARYLRTNMALIDQEEPIPFESELEHTRIYLEIEQMRFEDHLQVRYDVACTDFRIPALTLEPLVENAVRHGVRGREDGRGTVTISSWDTQEEYLVSVQDDGPGFDPLQPPEDEEAHIGISNVRERLEQACGGMLVIESAPGQGTKVTIHLPKAEGERTGQNAAKKPRDKAGQKKHQEGE